MMTEQELIRAFVRAAVEAQDPPEMIHAATRKARFDFLQSALLARLKCIRPPFEPGWEVEGLSGVVVTDVKGEKALVKKRYIAELVFLDISPIEGETRWRLSLWDKEGFALPGTWFASQFNNPGFELVKSAIQTALPEATVPLQVTLEHRLMDFVGEYAYLPAVLETIEGKIERKLLRPETEALFRTKPSLCDTLTLRDIVRFIYNPQP